MAKCNRATGFCVAACIGLKKPICLACCYKAREDCVDNADCPTNQFVQCAISSSVHPNPKIHEDFGGDEGNNVEYNLILAGYEPTLEFHWVKRQ